MRPRDIVAILSCIKQQPHTLATNYHTCVYIHILSTGWRRVPGWFPSRHARGGTPNSHGCVFNHRRAHWIRVAAQPRRVSGACVFATCSLVCVFWYRVGCVARHPLVIGGRLLPSCFPLSY